MSIAATAPALAYTRYLGSSPRLRSSNWIVIGQDGGQTIELGGQTLFLFSDTLLACSSPAFQRQAGMMPFANPLGEQGVFLANSAGLAPATTDIRQAQRDIRYYTNGEGFPREILEPTPEESARAIRFWPEHGIDVGGKVFIYYLGVQTVDASTMWGFRNLGAGLAVLDPVTGQCHRIRLDGDWLLWSGRDDLHFGVQVLREGEYVYAFGSARDGYQSRAFLARVSPSRLAEPDAYEYLQDPSPRWGHDFGAAYDMGPCGSEYSVSYNPYLSQYMMTFIDSYKKTLMMRTAPNLIGPYSAPVKLIGVPAEPASELVYLAFEHPQFRRDGGRTIYITYCQPYFTPNSLVEVRFR